MDLETLAALFRALDREKVRYVLVGAVALAVHGLARATRDVDIFVSPESANIESLKRALQSIFKDPSIDEISAGDLSGAYPAIRYVAPDGGFVIDIVARLGDAFRFQDLEAEDGTIEGVPVRVVTVRTLYRMTKDTLRLQDRADAEALRERYGLEDE